MTDVKIGREDMFAEINRGVVRWHYMDAKTIAGYGPWVTWDDYKRLLDAIEAAEAERDRLREALKPFDSVAGVLFARNYNASDAIFDSGASKHDCLFFADFLALRAALQKDTDND